MKTLLQLLLAFFITSWLFPLNIVMADVAPPMQPPGSSIYTDSNTYVQMVSETVILDITEANAQDGIITVSADFVMRNQGNEAEELAVRFPLENPEGWGDGYMSFPQIEDFSVSVNGKDIPYTTTEEPFKEDMEPISWAVFSVVFPVGEKVTIQTDYITELSEIPEGQAIANYIFETGDGWYGPIGHAALILRLPYNANPSSVYWDTGRTSDSAPTFDGREVHWEWSDFNPTSSDNFSVYMVWPHKWLRILQLEAELDQNPSDIEAVIALTQAYRESGSEKHGLPISSHIVELSENTVSEALSLSPNNPDLHIEIARIHLWQVPSWDRRSSQPPDDPLFDQAMDELSIAMQLDSENVRALKLIEELGLSSDSWMILYLPDTSTPSTELPATTMPRQNPTDSDTAENSDVNNSTALYVFLIVLVVILGVIMLVRFRLRNRGN